jgi:hypothetical protein
MPKGRRARFGGHGRERAGWLLAAVVLFGVLLFGVWAVAQVLACPVWAWASLAGLAAAALSPRLRDLVKRSDARGVVPAGRVVTVAGDSDRLPLVWEASRPGCGAFRWGAGALHRAGRPTEGCRGPWPGVGGAAGGALDGRQDSLAAQVVRQRFPQAPLLIPESGKALRELVIDEGLDVAGVVVWLDDQRPRGL